MFPRQAVLSGHCSAPGHIRTNRPVCGVNVEITLGADWHIVFMPDSIIPNCVMPEHQNEKVFQLQSGGVHHWIVDFQPTGVLMAAGFRGRAEWGNAALTQ